ncbi:MAG: DUF222 domain-containing protein, partial [Gammaproteobacteria bacterium]|nr:DUF222 domain-containing protein [Gammaproteobacteria bacterium]
ASRELTYYYDDDGSLVIRARLPAEEGAVVLQALNAAMDARYAQQNEVESDDVTAVTSEPSNRFAQRRADALSTLAETTLRHGPTPLSAAERYQVVVHVTAEALAGDDAGRCEIEILFGLVLAKVRRLEEFLQQDDLRALISRLAHHVLGVTQVRGSIPAAGHLRRGNRYSHTNVSFSDFSVAGLNPVASRLRPPEPAG